MSSHDHFALVADVFGEPGSGDNPPEIFTPVGMGRSEVSWSRENSMKTLWMPMDSAHSFVRVRLRKFRYLPWCVSRH